MVINGADIDRPLKMGRTALHLSLRQGYYDAVDVLLSLGASTTRTDNQGLSAIHHACLCARSAEGVSKLLERGILVEQVDSHLLAPLHWAAKSGSAKIVATLLEAGTNKSKLDKAGMTPLRVATFCRNTYLRARLAHSDTDGSDWETEGEEHINVICNACDKVSPQILFNQTTSE